MAQYLTTFEGKDASASPQVVTAIPNLVAGDRVLSVVMLTSPFHTITGQFASIAPVNGALVQMSNDHSAATLMALMERPT